MSLDKLTQRELDVTRLIVSGLTQKEVGAKLGLAPGTISSTLYHLYAKLRIKSAVELTRYCIKHKLFLEETK